MLPADAVGRPGAGARAGPGELSATQPWKILVVDDDPEVHGVSRLALRSVRFDDRPVEILEAHSAQAARQILQERTDIALMLLDVVMETEEAGLELVPWVREKLGNCALRIVLRTGQPGTAPPYDVMARYEIDDYRAKTELTFERLRLLVVGGLRAYRQIRELTEANLQLEQFAYAVSHDLQTPLRGIIGFAQLLERQLPKEDERNHDLLAHILRSGRDLHGLVTSLLQYARIGRERQAAAVVDLNAIVARALGRLRALVEERGAHVQVATLPSVLGVSVQLEQLFTNLIENAIKYQPGPAPGVEIACRGDGTHWEIRVIDRGIGIEAKHLRRIFELFTRLEHGDSVPGSGIGLAICRKVVELHGGSLHAESQPGVGTTMVIRLPAAAGKAPGGSPP